MRQSLSLSPGRGRTVAHGCLQVKVKEGVRYISTRGEAPELGFVDATLTGLARDGGLYIPQHWPRLDAAQIVRFAGRPYCEVACELIALFAGDEIEAADSRA